MNRSEANFYENYLTTDFHRNTVISRHVCLPIKMASKTVIRSTTSSNQRLGSAFDDLDPRLSLFVMSSAPAKKSVGDARCASQDPSTQRCPIKS